MWIYLALISTVVFWGGTFSAGRLIAQDISPFSAAFLRFFIASICLILMILLKQKRWPRLSKEDFLPLFILGLTGIAIYNGFFFMGLKHIEAGRASLIIATVPVMIALFSAVVFHERLSLIRISGIVLSLTGAMIVISRAQLYSFFNGQVGLGELYIGICAICWAIYTLVGKGLLERISPLVAVMYASLLGMLLLFPFALREGLISQIAGASLYNWLGLGYLSVFGTVLGFVWYYKGVRAIGPTRSGIFINFVPVSAILLSSLFLHESLTASLLLGGILVLAGVFLNNSRSKTEVA